MSQRALLEKATVEIRRLRAKLEAARVKRSPPIAVVGIGCRFPGGAVDPAAYWRSLDSGVDGVGEIPTTRWPLGGVPDLPGVRWAGLLDQVDMFDPEHFGISRREASSMDPQHRLLLEVASEALEHGGFGSDALGGSRTGVFVGLSTQDYKDTIRSDDLGAADGHATTGNAPCFAAGRVSYVLGLQGPCLTVDTACSSSLVSTDLACRSLRDGSCDLALAGGVNLILSPLTMVAMAHTQALSPSGRCRTFDAGANGYARGEGCGVVVLKRLADAERDADRIWAVIRGTAVNQDGRSTGFTQPSARAQQAVLQAALDDAGIGPERVDYIEAHGTGTPIGDPIEVEALAAVLAGERAPARCVLGAVKTNIGHLEAAAGVAGLIKLVLALEHERIPGNLHFEALNPMIELAGTPFEVATDAVPWPRAAVPRVAGVSAFGLSGTNAHVVVEEAPPQQRTEGAARDHVLVVSARTESALAAQAEQIAGFLDATVDVPLADVCHSANVRRRHWPYRMAAVGRTAAELSAGLRGGPSSFASDGAVRAAAAGQGPDDPRALAERYVRGEAVDWRAIEDGQRRTVALPTYPFERQPCWYSPPVAAPAPRRDQHPLLATSIRSSLDGSWLWQGEIGTGRLPWLRDHQVEGKVVVPAALLAEAMLGAAAQARGDQVAIGDLRFLAPLVLSDDAVSVQVGLTPAGALQVSSLSGETWTRHAEGQIGSASLGSSATVEPSGDPVDGPALYAAVREAGLEYGPAFRGVQKVWASDGSAVADVGTPPAAGPWLGRVHPALLDVCFQVMAAAIGGTASATYVPSKITRLQIFEAAPESGRAVAEVRADDGQTVAGDVALYDRDGRVVAAIEGLEVRRLDRTARYLYTQAWSPLAVPGLADGKTTEALESRGPLLVLGDGAFATDLQARLTALVQPLPPDVEAATALVKETVIDAAAPIRAVVLPVEAGQAGARASMTALLHLVQALGRWGFRNAPRLWLVTRGAQAADPTSAQLWGLGATVAIEHPDVRCSLVDLDSGTAAEIGRLAGVVNADGAEDRVLLVGEQAFAARLHAAPASDGAAIEVRASGAYLITGGLGGLGLVLAGWLVQQGARSLVLMGRRAPGPAAAASVEALQDAGCEVAVVQGDVCAAEDVQRALHAAGPVIGVFHAAGVLDDGMLVDQSWARYQQVLAPKVDGARTLHEATKTLELDLFVLFSSAAGVLGSPGQGSYAAGNAFQDALARSRAGEGLPAISIAWAPWAEVGMAAVADRRRQLSARGVPALSTSDGLAVLARLLRRPRPNAVVLPLPPGQWSQLGGLVAGRPLYTDLVTDAVPSGDPALLAVLGAAAVSDRRPIIETAVLASLAFVLETEPERLEPEVELIDLGVDSLLAVDLRDRLQATFGIQLPATLAWDCPTVDALVAEVAKTLSLSLSAEPADAAGALAGDEDVAALLEAVDGLSEDALMRALSATGGGPSDE